MRQSSKNGKLGDYVFNRKEKKILYV